MYPCDHCRRRFRTIESVKAHTNLFHRKKMDDYDNYEPVAYWNEHSPKNSETNEDEEDEENEEEEENSKDTMDQDSSDSDDDFSDTVIDTYKELIQNAINNMNWDGKLEELFKEPNYSLFHQELGDEVYNFLKKARCLKRHDVLYDTLQTAEAKSKQFHLEEQPAFQSAWDCHKYALKKYLSESSDTLFPDE